MTDYSYKIKQLQLMLEYETDENTDHFGAHLSHWAGKAKDIQIYDDGIQALIDFYELAGGQVDHLKLHTYDLQTIVIALIYYETELEHSKYRTPDPEEMDRIKRLQDVFNGMNKMVREENDYNLDIIARA